METQSELSYSVLQRLQSIIIDNQYDVMMQRLQLIAHAQKMASEQKSGQAKAWAT